MTSHSKLFSVLLAASAIVGQHQMAAGADRSTNNREQRTPPKVVVNTNALPKDTRGITSFAPVIKRAGPSVVTIYSTKSVRQNLGASPFNDPFFRRFFGFGDPEEEGGRAPGRGGGGGRGGGRGMPPQERKEQSLGSGVIISSDGYILSNNHVVEGADEVKVALSGTDDEYIAKVIGADPQTDISVLKIDRKDLTPVTITDSDHLQVGDVVLAIGNPFGVGQTVTMGIVSATSRGGFGIVDYEDFIQTDASINPGNSGGALVDADGRLVGINTAIISRSGGNMGIGFAVPINMVRRVMDAIIQNGKVLRGYLGVYIQDLTPQLATEFGLKDRSGALVGGVPPNTPAAEAGLREGDVVTEFNGRKVPDSRQLRLWVSQTPPKTKVSLKVIRDGKEQTKQLTLGELPSEIASSGPGGLEGPGGSQKSDALDGVEVSDLDQSTRRQFEIPGDVRGAIVTSVDPTSTAAAAGLRPGDVIVEINRKRVASSQDAIDITNQLKSDQRILLRVWSAGRGAGGTRFLVVEPEKKSDQER